MGFYLGKMFSWFKNPFSSSDNGERNQDEALEKAHNNINIPVDECTSDDDFEKIREMRLQRKAVRAEKRKVSHKRNANLIAIQIKAEQNAATRKEEFIRHRSENITEQQDYNEFISALTDVASKLNNIADVLYFDTALLTSDANQLFSQIEDALQRIVKDTTIQE